MAGIALELSALTFISRATETARAERPPRPAPPPSAHADTPSAHADVPPCHAELVEARPSAVEAAPPITPLDFLKEAGDAQARYYRASDEQGVEVLAGFYADGRVRLADAERRYAGMVVNGHADLLDIANNAWSELFLSVTPSGRMQLELRGGPYDAHVLTCEALRT